MRWRRVGGWGVLAALLTSTGCCWWCDRWCGRPYSGYAPCPPTCCGSSPVVAAAPPGPSFVPQPQPLPVPAQQTGWNQGGPQTLVRRQDGCYCPQ